MKDLPSIILISPPSRKSGEVEMLKKFFDSGLMRFHLRKPNFSAEELMEYLDQVPKEHLSKIVIHRVPEMTNEFPLAGYHHTSTEKKHLINGTSSRSFHKISELKNLNESLDYLFFGPVYNSISKKGHTPKISLNEIFSFFKSGTLKKLKKVPKVYALGGIRKKKMSRLAEVGFDGFALLGSVWGSTNPLGALNDILKVDLEFMIRKRGS